MNCQHCRDVMFDFFETDFSPAEHRDVLLHLQGCEKCRKLYELTEAENRILKDTSYIPMLDDGFNLKVMTAIKASTANQPQAALKHRGFAGLSGSAFAKVAVAAVLLLACLYVPGILPELQKSDMTKQAIINEKSTAPSSVALNNKEKASADTQQAQSKMMAKEDQNAYTGNNNCDTTSPNVNSDLRTSKSISDSGSVPASNLPAILYDGLVSESQPSHVNEDAISSKIMSTGATSPNEASRSMTYGVRTVKVKNADILSLKNIPSRFVLTATQNVSDNQMEFSFEDAAARQSFSVNVAPVADTNLMKASDTEEAANTEAAAGAADQADSDDTYPQEYSRIIEYSGNAYQIVVSGNMNHEDLDRITNTIGLGPLSK